MLFILAGTALTKDLPERYPGYQTDQPVQLPPFMTDELLPGDFAVTEVGNDGVYRVTQTGTVETIAVGGLLDGPTGIAVDADGNMIIGCESTRNILVVTPDGTVTLLTNVGTYMSLLSDLDIDNNGDYIVVGSSAVVKVTPAGAVSVVTSGGVLSTLQAVCIDPVTNDYFVAKGSTNASVIWRVTPAGNVTEIVSGSPLINFIEGLEIDVNGDLIVADEYGDAVHKVTQSGVVTTIYSGTPLQAPEDICIDANGDYFITDDPSTTENVVYKLTPGGIISVFASSPTYFNIIDGIAYYYPVGTHDITVTLSPYGMPITIPANGGSFEFNIEVANLEINPVSFTVWTMATLPGGGEYGPIINTFINAPASWSANRDRTQLVPASAPSGNYTYDAYVGFYPNNIWDEDHFAFEKLAVNDCGSFPSGWSNWGEDFTDTKASNHAISPNCYQLDVCPNPFNPETTIMYELEEYSRVSLIIYDVNGRKVAILAEGWESSGFHSVDFRADDFVSGIYFCVLSTTEQTYTKKLVLLK